jgi:hypothetical protein
VWGREAESNRQVMYVTVHVQGRNHHTSPIRSEGDGVGSLRRAMLDPKFRTIYPEIPAGHWIPAWQAAMRRADRLWLEAGAEALIQNRILPEEHFRFLGGDPRPSDWYPTPERLSDPTGEAKSRIEVEAVEINSRCHVQLKGTLWPEPYRS